MYSEPGEGRETAFQSLKIWVDNEFLYEPPTTRIKYPSREFLKLKKVSTELMNTLDRPSAGWGFAPGEFLEAVAEGREAIKETPIISKEPTHYDYGALSKYEDALMEELIKLIGRQCSREGV